MENEIRSDAEKAAGLYGGRGVDDYDPEWTDPTVDSPSGIKPAASKDNPMGYDSAAYQSESDLKPRQPGREPGFDASSLLTDLGVDGDRISGFNTLGLNQKQAEGVLDLYRQGQEANQAAWEAQQQADLATLQDTYGDSLDSTAKAVNGLLSDFDKDGAVVQLLARYRAQNNPTVFNFLRRISERLRQLEGR